MGGMRNQNADLNIKYHQWQKIASGTILSAPEVDSFESVGQDFKRGNLENCNYSVLRNSKLNALTSEAMAHYANGGERFIGNLVLSSFGWDTGCIELSESKNVSYTSINGQKCNMSRIKLAIGMRAFEILTPRVYLKRVNSEASETDFSHSAMLHCLSFSSGQNTSKQALKGKKQDQQLGGVNVNRSPETVLESSRNDWKSQTAADKQRKRASEAFLSKVKKNKSRSKYDRNVAVMCN